MRAGNTMRLRVAGDGRNITGLFIFVNILLHRHFIVIVNKPGNL